MKKRTIATCMLGVCILITLIFVGNIVWDNLSDYGRVLNANWNIILPKEAHYTEVYYQKVLNDEYNFLGDGIRYHVFEYTEEQPIAEFLDWEENESRSIHSGLSYSITSEKWLDEIEVPTLERPNYEDCLYWHKNGERDKRNEIIIFWDKIQQKLYVVECFF